MTVEFKQTIPILRIFDVDKTLLKLKCMEITDPFSGKIRFNENLMKDSP